MWGETAIANVSECGTFFLLTSQLGEKPPRENQNRSHRDSGHPPSYTRVGSCQGGLTGRYRDAVHTECREGGPCRSTFLVQVDLSSQVATPRSAVNERNERPHVFISFVGTSGSPVHPLS